MKALNGADVALADICVYWIYSWRHTFLCMGLPNRLYLFAHFIFFPLLLLWKLISQQRIPLGYKDCTSCLLPNQNKVAIWSKFHTFSFDILCVDFATQCHSSVTPLSDYVLCAKRRQGMACPFQNYLGNYFALNCVVAGSLLLLHPTISRNIWSKTRGVPLP